MSTLRTMIAVAAIALSASATAWADGGHWHHRGHHGPRFSVIVGPIWNPWLYPPYPYYYHQPPVLVERSAPHVYIEQTPVIPAVPPPQTGANYWYYCSATESYWPYASECPGGWQRVVPQPPGQ